MSASTDSAGESVEAYLTRDHDHRDDHDDGHDDDHDDDSDDDHDDDD